MKIDDHRFRICGLARGSMDRFARLRATVERLHIEARREGDRLLVSIQNASDVASPELNIHHSETPQGGYPFLDGVYGVRLEAGQTHTFELAAAGCSGPFHIVFQIADAFEGRTVG